MNYQIRIKGHLKNLVEWINGLEIILEDDGNTMLTGYIVDQAALHGLLKNIHDLGIPLISVTPIEKVVKEVEK